MENLNPENPNLTEAVEQNRSCNTDNQPDKCDTCPYKRNYEAKQSTPVPKLRRNLFRPSDAFFPLVGLLCALLGYRTRIMNFFFMYFLIQLCSLCCAGAFRNAATRELSVRRVEKRFGGALVQLVFGVGIMFAGVHYLKLANIRSMSFIALTASAALKILEQLFEEYLFASKKQTDAMLLSLISNVLLACGLIMDATGGIPLYFDSFYTLCTAGIGVAVGFFISCMVVRAPRISLLPRNLGYVPKAIFQTLLYPVLAMAAIYLYDFPLIAAMAGLIPWRLARTVCRRSQDESRPLDLLLMFFSAFSLMVILLINTYPPYDALMPYAYAFFAAMLCAELVFCAPSVRLYLGTLMVAGAGVIMHIFPFADDLVVLNPLSAAALCSGAIFLNFKNAFLKHV